MSKDPAFLFYTSDFLTGCSDLTMEERGQYITLICLQHQKGHLTRKIIEISVGSVSPDVMSKFEVDDNGLYYNKRIEEVIEQRKNYTESRRKNGSLGGRPKKPYAKPYGLPYAEPYGKATGNLPENEIEIVNVNKNVNEILNNLSKKISLKKGQYLIDENFNIYQIPDIELYRRELGDKVIEDVYKWLVDKKQGKVVDNEFICRQIINFSKRQRGTL